MFNVGSVQGYLKLNTTGWDSPMRSANASVARLTRSFTRLGVVATGSLLLIEREFGRFDKAIRHATSVSEVTQKQFEQMSEMALDASVQWNKAATQTAQAFYFLGSAGLTVTEQMDAFNDTIMLSRAMGSELGQTVEGVVDIVRAFGLEFADITNIADQLTKTVISSNQQFRTLAQALSYASSTARLTNNTLAETTAMLGVMANAGIKGSMAGTVLRRAMTNLMAPTGGMAELIYELGLSIYDIRTGQMKPFIAIMGELSDRLAGTSDEYRNMVFETLFGRRAIAGQIQLFNFGSVALRRYADEIKNATGTTARVAGKQMKAFTEVLGRLWQEMRRISIIVGGLLAPAIERFSERIRHNMGVFREYIKANSEAIKELLKWIALVGALGVAIPVAVAVASALLSLVTPFTVAIASLYLLRTVWDDTFKHGGVLNKALDDFGNVLTKWADEHFGILDDIMKILYLGVSIPLRMPGALWEGITGPQARDYFGLDPKVTQKAITSGKDVLAAGEKAGAALAEMTAKRLKDDAKIFADVLTKGFGKLEGADGVLGKLKKLIDTLTDLKNVFMIEPSKFKRAFAIPDFASMEATTAMDTIRKSMEVWRTGPGSAREASIWSIRWKRAMASVMADTKKWSTLFIETGSNIRTAWAYTMESLIDEGGNFGDFMQNMFMDVLNSFNRMVAEIAANRLFAAIFGKGALARFGAIAGRQETPTQPRQLMIPTPSILRPPTAFTPEPPGFGMGAAVEVNILNKGVPQKVTQVGEARIVGKRIIVNAIMEEYQTNPNFRNALGR